MHSAEVSLKRSLSESQTRPVNEAGGLAFPAGSRFWLLPLAVFLAVLTIGAGVGLLLYRSAQRSVVHYIDVNLDLVAHLKADQTSHWLEEIEENIELELPRLHLADAIRRWHEAGAGEGAAADELVGTLARLCAVPEATDCSLHSPSSGKLWLSNGFGSDSDPVRAQAVSAASQKEPQLEDFYAHHRSNPGHAEIGYFYGVRTGTSPYPSVAVLHVSIDPSGLFRVLGEGWPGLNRSFEVALLRRDGGAVNESIADRDAPKEDRPAAAPPNPPQLNVLAVHGATSLLTGTDDRLVPVFARAVPVFGTPWFVMTKLDRSEAFAQLDTLAILGATAFSSILLIGCLAWAGRRRQLLILEHGRFERLMLARRIDYLARYANDGIILCDADAHVLEVNDRGALSYGYAASEMKGMHLADLLPEAARSQFQTLLAKLQSHGSLIYETEHRRKDGSTFPVEISACLIDAEGKRFLQAIVRDVSERRNAEAARESNMRRQKELSHRLISIQEQERKRISAELHDGTVASLAAIKLNLSAIARALPDTWAFGSSIVSETRELLSETIEQIRELCADLRPSVLDRIGLAAAIESSARHLTLRSGLHIHVHCDEFERRLSPDVESMFFRVAQEALRNCARHANARKVEIRLARSNGCIELTITDDGVGFAPNGLEPFAGAEGLGLTTMRERAEFASGQFEITSFPGQGTRVRVRLEVEKAFESVG